MSSSATICPARGHSPTLRNLGEIFWRKVAGHRVGKFALDLRGRLLCAFGQLSNRLGLRQSRKFRLDPRLKVVAPLAEGFVPQQSCEHLVGRTDRIGRKVELEFAHRSAGWIGMKAVLEGRVPHQIS